jgi:hypothetical protein
MEQEEGGPQVQWYLRMFKDVELPDLEMLLPGGVIGLSWFDWLYICGPIAFSMCYAIYIVRAPLLPLPYLPFLIAEADGPSPPKSLLLSSAT